MRLWLTGLVALGAGCVENALHPRADDPSGVDGTDPNGTDGDHTGDPDTAPTGLGSISGRICAPNEATWVGGADVWVEQPNGQISKDITDADGWFLLTDVLPGIHTVRVAKGSFQTEFLVEVFADFETRLAQEECLRNDVEIAVVTGVWDRIQIILDRLGLEPDIIDGVSNGDHVRFLRDPWWLDQYDIVFLNCGMDDEAWIPYRDEVGQNLRDYVLAGGSVYTSDMSYFAFEAAFPDAIDYLGDDTVLYDSNRLLGPATITADIVDNRFATAVGADTAELIYEASGTYAAGQSIGTATSLVEADFEWHHWGTGNGGWTHGILAAELKVGTGRILFTSFHNVHQEPSELDPLMEHMVLSL